MPLQKMPLQKKTQKNNSNVKEHMKHVQPLSIALTYSVSAYFVFLNHTHTVRLFEHSLFWL